MNISYRYVDAKNKFSGVPLAALLSMLIASVALSANAAGGNLMRTTLLPMYPRRRTWGLLRTTVVS